MTGLPPLRAIQVFEALGRTGSVTAAAAELGVSPGAVTHQIHSLERYLGFRLVQRHGRGIALTHLGTLYLPQVGSALELLRKAGTNLELARRSNHLRISALPSLAIKWLGPLLFEWKSLHSQANIVLDGADPDDDGAYDFRISYGNRRRLHQRAAHLFTDFLIPVASRSLIGPQASPLSARELLDFPLLWVDWGAEFAAVPTWRNWFASAGLPDADVRCDLTFSLSSSAIDAAVEGRGLVLGQNSMIAGALAAGNLVRLSDHWLSLPEDYFIAWNSSALDKPMGAAFHTWLRDRARRFEAPAPALGPTDAGDSRAAPADGEDH
ncbi:MAG: LysR family transcriptional regulator [Proteobacteria bacterium]|nr:LysR family transcriptional regulator [Pseudomonadota bacterium]